MEKTMSHTNIEADIFPMEEKENPVKKYFISAGCYFLKLNGAILVISEGFCGEIVSDTEHFFG